MDKLIRISDVLALLPETDTVGPKPSALRKAIEALPTVDADGVVRCKDCKHKGWVQEPCHGKSVDYCRLLERCVDLRFFCAAGEPKMEGGSR